MRFEILTADGASGERWSQLVAALPPALRDLHFLPDYGLIYRDTYGQEPLLAVYQDDSGFVLQPLVRRALDDLPFLASTGEHAADIANPYGFGGPLASVTGPAGHELVRRFVDQLDAWCDREQIASEFASLHPLLIEQQLPALVDLRRPERAKDVVVVRLAGGEDALRAGLSRGQRSNIAKASRHGVQVERVPADQANLATFNDLYYATMHRRDAAARWFFPERYFADCVRHLGDAGASLFFARIDGEVESAYLLLHAFTTAYYHFGGSRGLRPEARASNLLMYETARWAQAQSYATYHLGGGVTAAPDDSLLQFKAGFSSARAPLYTYFRVHHAPTYDRLCAHKRHFERTTLGAEIASDYVPLYRR